MPKSPTLALAICLAALCGCKGKNVQAQPSLAANSAGSSAPATGSGSDEIRPLAPGAGPMTPVAGGENLGGTTGGGVAQIAKERAKTAAAGSANASQSAAGDD